MSYVDVLKDEIEANLRAAEKDLAWLDANAPTIIRTALNAYLDTIAPLAGAVASLSGLEDQLIERVRAAIEDARRGIAYTEKLVEFLGSPDTLRAAADAISHKIIAPARDLAPDVSPSRVRSALDEYWKDGDASRAYQQAVTGRQDAVEQVVTYAQPLATALGDLADEIENFYVALAAAVVGLVAAIGGAVEIILTLVGVVTAPAAILGAVVAAMGIVSAVIGVFNLVIVTQQAITHVTGNLSEHVPAWPKALV